MQMRTVAATTDTAVRKIIDIDPYFVRRGKNGWEPCDRQDAEAICKNNVLYAITDEPVPIGPIIEPDGTITDEMQYAPQAVIYDVPDGSLIVDLIHQGDAHSNQITDLETGTVDLGDAVADLESGALDLADALDVSTSETETALVDLADTIETLNERIEALETKGE